MDIASLFANYRSEAFRLETLPVYNVQSEREAVSHFKKTGQIIRDDSLIDYLNEAGDKIKQGARHVRVRVIDDPLPDYQRFEIKAGYEPLAQKGGEIFGIARADFNDLISGENLGDFWLFDQAYLLLMHYDESGDIRNRQIVTDVDIVENYKLWRDRLLNAAYGFADFPL